MWLPIVGILVGILIGLLMPVKLPVEMSAYLSIAILAALDTVFGGIRAMMEDHFKMDVFLTGFFGNALLAAGLGLCWGTGSMSPSIWQLYLPSGPGCFRILPPSAAICWKGCA